jgi:hypothetical protein
MRLVLPVALAIALIGTAANSAGVYEGQIDGDFTGWTGETIYKLRDGHIIQQASYHYHYHYAYAPNIIIYQDHSGLLMIHVEGDDDEDVQITVLK